MLLVMQRHGGGTAGLRPARRRRRPHRSGLLLLNVAGWSALVALGSVVSVLAALRWPLPVALVLGLGVSAAAYAAEWLMTRRGIRSGGGGPMPPGGGSSGGREPRPPASPPPTLDARRTRHEARRDG